jgi:hypothetical protein
VTRAGDLAIRWATTISVVVLAGIAAVLSYKHMRTLVLEYGETSWTAALLPVSVDGMIVASSMTLLADSRNGQRSGLLPWTLLVIGSTASLAANVAVAEPSLVGRLIAAWPSAALIGSYELLMRQVRNASHSMVRAGSDAPHTSPLTCQSGSYELSYELAGNGAGSYASHTSTVTDDAGSYEPHTSTNDAPRDGSDDAQTDTGEAHTGSRDADRGRAADDERANRDRSPSRRPASVLQRQAWQWALANRTPRGDLPSGKAIAQEFGRRERWGRLVKQSGLAGRLDPAAIA